MGLADLAVEYQAEAIALRQDVERMRHALREIRERALRRDDAVLYRIASTALDGRREAPEGGKG